MEGSCNPNMEAELADAMKSDRSSSSSCSSYENVSNVSDLEDSSRLEPGSTEYVSARITGNEIYDESGKRLCEANIVVNETRSKAPINAVEDSKVNEEMNYLRDSEKPEKSDSINEPASGKVTQKLDINKRIFSDTGISQTCHTKSKYDNLKVTRKNKQWVLSDGKTENILSEFNEEDGVVLNICDDDVYLQAHDKLYEVYIGTDGKAVVTQIQEGTIVCQTAPDEAATKVRDQKSKDAQTISNESMDADETHVVDNKCLDDAYKQEGLPSNDQVADQELKGDGNIGVFLAKDAVHTRKLQSNEQTFPDKKCNKPSHDDTKYDRVKVAKKNKQWLLSDGKTEYILSEFNEEDDITLNVCDDDIYLQTDDQLFEVTFDTDGKIVVTQIQEGTIVCQPPSGGAATKERNKKSDAQVAENDSGSIEESRVLGNESKSRNSFDAADKEKPFPSDFMKIDGSNATLLSKEEMTHLQEQDLKRATSSNSVPDAVLNLEDLFKKMDIKHDVDVDSSSVKENDIGKDSRKNTNLQKADEQSSRAASIKTNKNAEVSFTHIGSQTYTGGTGPRSALQSNFVGYSSYSDGLHMTAPLHMTDNATMENVNAKTEEKHFNKDTGARPKQPTGKTVQNNEDANRSRNSAEDSLFENKNTMGDALFRKEYGPDGCRTAFQALKESDDENKDSEMGLQEDSKGGSGFGAVAVQVDSNSAFCYLKDSEYVAQLAKDKNVNIKSLQIPGCKGFEIEGQFSAVLKAEEDFKRTVANIESASVILTGGRKSAADTDEDILEIKTKTQERFDVFVKVVEKKSVKDSLKHIADIGLKTEKEIIKDDKPGSVSWCFPGGYRISLCKRPLNDAPAIVHVYFTRWNGKTKQLHHEILDDGTGGYIVKVTAGLPKFRGMGNDTSDLRSLFAKILEKSGHDDHNSVSFSLEEIQNWSMVSFLECLLAATWEHFKSPNTDKPIFIELCHSREAEYQTVNYHCHALVKSLMENDIDCMKSQPLQIKVVVNKLNCIQAFRCLMDACLTKAAELGCGTIAFPVLGAGNLRYPVDLVAAEMFTCVAKFKVNHQRSSLRTVSFVVYPADQETLRIFRQVESDLKGTDEQKRLFSEADDSDENEDKVESLKVEVTGLQPIVKDASKFVEINWKELVSDKESYLVFRLPSEIGQAVCYGQDKGVVEKLKKVGAEISDRNSEFLVKAPSLKTLEESLSVVNDFSGLVYGHHGSPGRFTKLEIFAKIHNVAEMDFKVFEKLHKTSLDKYARNDIKVHYKDCCIAIKGKAKQADLVRNEIHRVINDIKRLKTCSVDVGEVQLRKETIHAIVQEVESSKVSICILIEKGQIMLFGKDTQTLNDLKCEISSKMKAWFTKQTSDSSTRQNNQKSQSETKSHEKTFANKHSPHLSPLHIRTASGVLKLSVYKGDLLETNVDCIVNAANEYLTHNAGVAAAIANAAGSRLIIESKSYYERHGRVSAGNIVVTTAGDLKYKGVIHAVGPNWRDYQPVTKETLQKCKLALQSVIRKSLDKVEYSKLKSVAIPAISAGHQGVPLDICALQYALAINEYLKVTKRPSIEEIHFVDLNQETVEQIVQMFHDFFIDYEIPNIDSKYLSETTAVLHTGKDATKFTGRPNPKPQNVPRFDQRASHGEEKEAGKVLSYPMIYESSKGTTRIRFSSCHELQVYSANILQLENVDAIVIREDIGGTAKGTIAKGLMEKGGPKYTHGKGILFKVKPSFGEVLCSRGGASQFGYVFHALIHHRQHFAKDVSKWYDAFRKILAVIFKKAFLFQVHSIAMPLFGLDSSVQDVSEYMKVYLDSFESFCIAHSTQQLTVHLINNESNLTTAVLETCHRIVSKKQPSAGKSVATYPPTYGMLEKEDDSSKKEATSNSKSDAESEGCVICLDEMKHPKKLECGHAFCKDCIDQHLKRKNTCPVCGKVLGVITGNQPKGQMKHEVIADALPGYRKYKTIRIIYSFGSGTQGPEHPEPGKHYAGITRVAFLPDNDDGRQILKLLYVAFARGLTFTIGQSRTTGHTGVITWNDIHHKTNILPNTQFGYPDQTYFDRVKDELAAKGVTVDDIDKIEGVAAGNMD